MNSSFGLPIGLLNGDFYLTSNTPKSYLFTLLLYKLPIYVLFSFFFLPFIFFNKKLIKNKNINFINFCYLLLQIIFPLIIIILIKPGLNDGFRYFLYLIPLFMILSSVGIYYLFTLRFILFKIIIIFLFIFNIFIFLKLTPYQYIFVNNLNGKFSNNLNKFENDYWGTSI